MDDAATVATATVGRSVKAPLYHQIYLLLRQQVLGGTLADGDGLPSEQDLSRRYGVSRITARRALDDLAAEGLAIRIQGRGTFVNCKTPTPPIESDLEGLLENLLMMGLKTEARLLAFDTVPAPDNVARKLRCAPKDPVQRAVRLRSVNGAPLSHLTTWVPGDIGQTYTRKDLERKPLLALLERAGVAVESAEQTITARLADGAIAPLLETETGAPLIEVDRVVRDAAGRGVEWLTALYPPDRYQYRMQLALKKSKGSSVWQPTDAKAKSTKRKTK